MFRSRHRELLGGQLLRLALGLAAPLAVVITFKLRVAGASDLSSVPASAILQHLADPGRWIVTVEALVVELLNFGRFLIPIALALALYWYLVRFRVDERDRASLATAAIALPLTLVAQLVIDILYVDNLSLEIGTSFERILLQLWPAVLLVFFLASGPLQLAAQETIIRKAKMPAAKRKTAKPGRSVAETH
jgi:hypothetical protein